MPSRPLPQSAVRVFPKTFDGTASFLDVYREVAKLEFHHSRASLPAEAYDHDYLFSPGLLTRWNAGYMEPNVERLTMLGLNARVTWVGHTMGAIAANGRSLAEVIERSERKLVMICHSKGALDAWDALRQRPELAEKIRAFVAVQSPVLGSRLADWYQESRLRRAICRLSARLMGGDAQAVWDLTTRTREAYASAHPFPTDRISTVSLVTTMDRRSHRFYLGRYALSRHGAGPNDGVVEPDKSVLPGSTVVRLDDMDHLDAFTGHIGVEEFFSSTTYDPANLSEALVRFLFRG